MRLDEEYPREKMSDEHSTVLSSRGKRMYMEDSSRIISDCDDYAKYIQTDTLDTPVSSTTEGTKTLFAGVFDGHGGSYCSKTLASCLAMHVIRQKEYANDLPTAIKKGFLLQNDAFCQLAAETELADGSTAVSAFIRNGKITVANVGDSRALLVRSDKSFHQLSTDHRPSNLKEKERIISRGGFFLHFNGIGRVNGILGVTRSFGDTILEELITAEPEIIEYDIKANDSFLVLASDGLWDVMKNKQVADHLCRHSKQLNREELLKNLIDTAMRLGSRDNITVLLIDLSTRRPDSIRKVLTKKAGQLRTRLSLIKLL